MSQRTSPNHVFHGRPDDGIAALEAVIAAQAVRITDLTNRVLKLELQCVPVLEGRVHDLELSGNGERG